MLGDIVHNEQVVEDLENVGTKVVKTLDDVPKDSPILFRAHGTVNELWEEAKSKKMNVIDATCPLVHEIHHEVKRLAEDGRQIIIIGDHGHDEVVAIANQVENSMIISSTLEASKLRKMKKVGVVSQSTQMIENVQGIMNILMEKVFDLHFVNTICYPTKRNHEQIKTLAMVNDVMIIIGSFTSANSKRLAELSSERNANSYQVTCAEDLNFDWFENKNSVGISAGASTPDYLIDEVKLRIQEYTRK
jgi:4-hydroxy-3-methylbut-2-enyl diphosphate reductase